MYAIKLNQITKSFSLAQGNSLILDGVDFSLNKGEILGIRGENGSGKTTLFNIIAGIENPSKGTVHIGNNTDGKLQIGAVFQNYNSTLLPWLNVKENICIPLKLKGFTKAKIDEKFASLMVHLKFESLPLKNYPHQLSGGQRQRIAIARALIVEPDILILDEPFANLDNRTSQELQDFFQDLHFAKNTSILLVSHNIDHVIYLADRILILNGHPSNIIKQFAIAISRPRKSEILISKKFEDLRNQILEFEYSTIQKNEN